MPRYPRPPNVKRSEHWLRVAANQASDFTNEKIRSGFNWYAEEMIEWRSPVKIDDYAEYRDAAFLERLGVNRLAGHLGSFWPRGGPRWDGLAKSSSNKCVLVEAKAYIEEGVQLGGSRAKSLSSIKKISEALERSKQAYAASLDADWESHSPFYQYINRLAHLHFLVSNNVDAYLLFLYFSNAPDVPDPCTVEQWEGARRLTNKCLGLGHHTYEGRIATVVIDVVEMNARMGSG